MVDSENFSEEPVKDLHRKYCLPESDEMNRASMLLILLPAYGAVAVWGFFLVNRIMALCDLYTGFGRGKPAVYIIFSVLCPPLIPFFIFRCHW